jgi:hypothetical protein
MGTLDLTGLPTEDAVALAQRRLDATFAVHLVQQRALMVRDGLQPDDIEGLLHRQIEFYLADREQDLDELKSWLLACDRKLH